MKVVTVMKLLLLVLFLSFQPLAFAIPSSTRTNQVEFLRNLIKSLKSGNSYISESWAGVEACSSSSPVYIGPQEGQMEADRITSLPGQPGGVDFNQYAGYVTLDSKTGKSLFYYFVESPQDSSTKPLVLWLNGGPGCSSLGYGAMEELGPFRVNSDGKTLYRNEYAWNNAANVLFLESPAGVGFSYSNTSSDYVTGDTDTAMDSYTFLVNWLERFPQHKTRDFYITGESYAGHYVPQLAYTIISNNKNSTNQTYINLKGIAIGNAYVDYISNIRGTYDYYWTHGLNSDETNAAINKYCDYVNGNFSSICYKYQSQGDEETGHIDHYSIYAPLCDPSKEKPGSNGSVKDFDPCSDDYVYSYLNLGEVQRALHAKPKNWEPCGGVTYVERVRTVLPTIKQLIASGIRLWMYSGDTDSVVPITDTRYAINALNLSIETAWRPWYTNKEVGGYVVGYKGLTFVTVRGAGHEVPSYQPERSLTMISSFLQGELPPSSS